MERFGIERVDGFYFGVKGDRRTERHGPNRAKNK